jgi:NAD(P)-dependent dehydrogenase (short-subunit alcohol dehydrogenase family)
MEPTKNTSLNLAITGAETELRQETTRQLVACGHQVTGLAHGKDGATAIRYNGGLPAETNPTSAAELKDAIRAAKADVFITTARLESAPSQLSRRFTANGTNLA